MTSLRVLVVGRDCPIAERLEDGGHHVTPVVECDVAFEALQLQNFDAVVLGEDVSPRDLDALAREIQELNRRSSVRTALLGIGPERPSTGNGVGLDGYLPAQCDATTLSDALSGAACRSGVHSAASSTPDQLAIFNLDELKEHLDHDTDLLLELIDLYHSERKRQSPEMRQALSAGDLKQLSRLAHTIKGSLGSLQAPAARAEAQLLELAALRDDREACERLLPSFEHKLNELEAELQALTRSLVESQ